MKTNIHHNFNTKTDKKKGAMDYKNYKIIILMVIVLVNALLWPNPVIYAETITDDSQWPKGPDVAGYAAIVMEASTGTILYEKNINKKLYPASITKIMTALVTLENSSLDEMVTVPHEAVYMEDKGSHIALEEGEELTVEQCLYAVMLASANDAAYSLAYHVGGNADNFVDMMNKKAKELGCKNTHFTNPHGLPDEKHYTTVYDMALITKEALKYDAFRKISGTCFYEIEPGPHQKDLIPMYNHHKMLQKGRYYYEGAMAGKTGYTVVAKNTLVTCAKKDGMELICVEMKTEGKQIYTDTATLLDFGFENYRKINISQEEQNYKEILASNGLNTSDSNNGLQSKIDKNCSVVIPKTVEIKNLENNLSYRLNESGSLATVTLQYSYGGHSVGTATLNEVGLENQLFQGANSGGSITSDEVEGKEKVTGEAAAGKAAENATTAGENAGLGFKGWYILIGILVISILSLAGYGAVLFYTRYYRKNKK